MKVSALQKCKMSQQCSGKAAFPRAVLHQEVDTWENPVDLTKL